MELLCGFRIESIGRLLHKNSIVSSRTLYKTKDGEFVQWYKREWTEFDAVKDNEQVLTILK
jgi:hypothetical protein